MVQTEGSCADSKLELRSIKQHQLKVQLRRFHLSISSTDSKLALYYISTQLTESELRQKQFLKKFMYDAAKAVMLATTVIHYHTKSTYSF